MSARTLSEDGIQEIPSTSSSLEKLDYTDDTHIYRLSCHDTKYVLHIYNNNCNVGTTTAQIETGAAISPLSISALQSADIIEKEKNIIVESFEKPKAFKIKQDINILQQQQNYQQEPPVWVKRFVQLLIKEHKTSTFPLRSPLPHHQHHH